MSESSKPLLNPEISHTVATIPGPSTTKPEDKPAGKTSADCETTQATSPSPSRHKTMSESSKPLLNPAISHTVARPSATKPEDKAAGKTEVKP